MEIETLQSRSTSLSGQLGNRQTVERFLGPAVEDASVPPFVVETLVKGPITHDWIAALVGLEKRWKTVNQAATGSAGVLINADLKPLLRDLTNIVSMSHHILDVPG